MSRIRQLVIAAKDFENACQEIADVLHTTVVHQDPSLADLGLQNALLPVNDCFIEVVSPIQEHTTAGRYLDRYGTTSHPGQDCSGYMIEMQVSDVAQVERVWTERGKRIILRPGRSADGRPIAYERDGNVHIPGLSGLHWHPKDIGVIMETAEHHPPEAWLYAGESWMSESRHRAVGLGFAAVEVAVDDPASMASEWSSGLQRPLSATGCGIVLADGAEVRFRRRRNSREDGLVGMDIWAAHDGHVGRVFDLCGVAVRLVQHTGGKLQSAL
eukprot:m.155199 g.155199  ORF g.155199 m.155199 type:complete len:271 (-) comp17934_c0_seq1:270-1082(-)